MTDLRIGSLFTGTGALDMVVTDVLGGSVAWHCQYDPEDRHQYAARILEHHWPAVPNLGDITQVDWTQVEPVDVLTAGFPCQDLSYAGRGAGIKKGTRSGLWYSVADAIRALRPGLVFLENVRAIVARRPGLDVVLASLAELGFDAEWTCVRASDVGAPHKRERWFLLAWPAGDSHGLAGAPGSALDRRPATVDEPRSLQRTVRPDRLSATPDATGQHAGAIAEGDRGGQPPAPARDCGGAAPNAPGDGRDEWRAEPAGEFGGPDAAVYGDATLADPAGERHGHSRPVRERGLPPAALASAAADADCYAVRQQPVSEPGSGSQTVAGLAGIEWGAYGPAVHRWAHILGRPAPSPVDDRGHLDPRFVEWMMGLPEGHVCGIPAPEGMTAAGVRNAQLKALGNGVVPQQVAFALRLLLARVGQEVAA